MRTDPIIFSQRCMSYTLILEAQVLAMPHKTNNSNNDNIMGVRFCFCFVGRVNVTRVIRKFRKLNPYLKD